MARRTETRRCGRTVVTLLACLSSVAVVQPTSLPPHARDLLFDKTPSDGTVVTATRGSDVELDCQAIGTPIPTIHWLHKGRRVMQGGRHDVRDDLASYESVESEMSKDDRVLRLGTTKSRLFIDCVRPSDAGVYTCVAETPILRIVTTIVLRVEVGKRQRRKERRNQNLPQKNKALAINKLEYSSNRCRNKRSKSNDESARVYMWTSQRMAKMGQDAQLYCRASGNPAPTVTWYDPEERQILPDDKQYQVLPNGDLLIRDVTWPANMGDYYCKVQNSAGSDVVDMFVYPTTT